MRTFAFTTFCCALAGSVSAQTRLDDSQKGVTIFEAEAAFLVCIDVKTDAGKDAPILLTSEAGGAGYVERIGMSGTCLNFADKKDIVVKATAMAEPVTVRVGPSRNALK